MIKWLSDKCYNKIITIFTIPKVGAIFQVYIWRVTYVVSFNSKWSQFTVTGRKCCTSNDSGIVCQICFPLELMKIAIIDSLPVITIVLLLLQTFMREINHFHFCLEDWSGIMSCSTRKTQTCSHCNHFLRLLYKLSALFMQWSLIYYFLNIYLQYCFMFGFWKIFKKGKSRVEAYEPCFVINSEVEFFKIWDFEICCFCLTKCVDRNTELSL
jgi:hypothetical protein